jgi:pimeloyl-ACP methyl ester carboxylesterase
MPYFATKDNCKLYYEERGEGKAVVFIHGWSCNRHFYKTHLPAFYPKYKVLSYDLRGHGDSERPEKGLTIPHFARDLKELIEYRDLKDVTLIGWSMGVYIIFDYIKQFGTENLSKIVLLDMTSKMVTDADWTYGLFGNYPLQAAVNYLEAITQNWDAIAEGFAPAMFDDDYSDKEEMAWVLSEAKKNTTHVMVNMWLSLIQQDYRELLPKIDIPTFVTYGSSKSLYAPECSEYIKEHIPNAKIAAFKGGHICHLEDAENFNKAVIEFVG